MREILHFVQDDSMYSYEEKLNTYNITMKKIINKNIIPILILVALITAFFVPILLPGRVLVTTGVTQSDWMNFNYPIKVAYAESLKNGNFPLWTPYIGSGFPLIAEGQVAAFYPLNILLFGLLDVHTAMKISLWLCLIIAGIGTYAFTRFGIKLSKIASIIAGLSFALSGFFAVHLVHLNLLQATVWFPLQFLLLEFAIKKKHTLPVFLALVATISFQILAGHPEMLYFIITILGFYTLARIFFSKQGQNLKEYVPLGLFILAGLIAGAITAIQLLPTLELTNVSNRSGGITYEEATSYLFPLSHLLTLVAPWAFDVVTGTISTPGSGDITNLWETYSYIGLLPFLLSLLSFKYVRKNRYALIFVILAVFVLLLSLGRTTPLFHIIWNTVPGMKLFRYQTRFIVFFQFALSVLAAFGWEYIAKELLPKTIKNARIITNIGLAVLIIIAVDLISAQWRIHKTTDIKSWFEPPQTAQFLEQNAEFYRYYPLSTSNILYSSVKDVEIQREVRELLPPNFNMIFKVNLNYGLYAFFPDTIAQINKTVDKKLSFDQKENAMIVNEPFLNLLSMQGAKYLIGDLPFKNENLSLVKTIKVEKPITHIVPLTINGQVDVREVSSDTIYIYENKKVLPRTFMVGNTVSSDENWTNIDFNNPNFDSTIYLKDFSEKIENAPDFQGNATIQEYENTKVTVKTTSNKKGFLFLSDTFYPGWKAYINGQEAKIYQANIAYRGVMVPAGESTVEFKYIPDSFKKGLIITLISVTLFIVGSTLLLIFVSHRKKRLA